MQARADVRVRVRRVVVAIRKEQPTFRAIVPVARRAQNIPPTQYCSPVNLNKFI